MARRKKPAPVPVPPLPDGSPRPLLLVDARNCMYRAIYAGKREEERGGRRLHYFTRMLNMMAGWVREFQPSAVQVFWDAPRSTVWRRKLHAGYKDRDKNHYIADISQDLVATERVARCLLEQLNVRQFKRDTMEADDLIYAACKLQYPQPMIICSSDSDMVQIPYVMNSVRVYDPEKHGLMPPPDCNPVQQKALMGDKSDRIDGYEGIGPVKARLLLQDHQALQQHLQQHGRRLYIRNLLLIDLGLCPELLANQLYVGRVLAQPLQFSRPELSRLTQEQQVRGLLTDYADTVLPFQQLPN